MTRKAFERIVREVLDDLPDEFRARIGNIEIAVEHEPTLEELESVGLTADDLLMGLYQGTPLPERGTDYSLAMPDRIVLYHGDIEQACEDCPDEIPEEIRKTLIHELAHYFGFDEDDIPF